MTSSKPRAALVVATLAVVLTVASPLRPGREVPVYGDAVPNDLYRYLASHGELVRIAPGVVNQYLSLEGDRSPAISIATNERPPQAELIAPQGGFTLPVGATGVTVLIRPIPPPPVPPLGSTFDGNVYEFALSASGAALPLRRGQMATVVLRGPGSVANHVLELFDGTRWRKLATQPLQNAAPDTYVAKVSALGDIALVSSPAPTDQGGGYSGAIVISATLLAVLAGAVLLMRWRPSRARLFLRRHR